MVPRTAQMDDDVSSHVADTAQLSLSPEITTRRTTVKARKGESVASLASRYGLTAASVANWNSVSAGSSFRQGHQVVLYLPISARNVATMVGSFKKPAPLSDNIKISPVRRSAGKTVVKSKRR
jgi:membrane-bound lytic murein transglycosylase D